MAFIELNCHVQPVKYTEVAIAELSDIGFDGFLETDDGFCAYIDQKLFNENLIKKLSSFCNKKIHIDYTIKIISEQNWNAEWERNFTPVNVLNQCYIRAPFHPKKSEIPLEIIIEPKMSFGTGHHETTHLMVQLLLQNDVKNKSLLDMGCGTGVLAILARKLGAGPVHAIDIDNWSFENTLENIATNNVEEINVELGDVSLIKNRTFDIIFANINRNILLNDIPEYSASLNQSGILALSGFYQQDLDTIKSRCEQFGIIFQRYLIFNNWVAALFRKK